MIKKLDLQDYINYSITNDRQTRVSFGGRNDSSNN
jgi:hypothetical protein